VQNNTSKERQDYMRPAENLRLGLSSAFKTRRARKFELRRKPFRWFLCRLTAAARLLDPMLKPFLSRLNQLPFWHQQIRVWESVYTAPTLDRLLSLYAHRFGWMGSAEARFLRSVVCRDSIVADIGANQGLYTVWLARLAASGHVYALEPDPELFQCLQMNIGSNQLTNITAIRAAAHSRPGTLAFAANHLNRGDNRVSTNSNLSSSLEKVPAVTIDEIVGKRSLDLLKIDVQGFEIEVLLGAKETLKKNQTLTIVVEFWPYGLRQAGHEPKELFQILENAGFSIAVLERDGRPRRLSPEKLNWYRATQYCNLVASRDPGIDLKE
jgi:FkbM family methyltransferase